MIPPNVHSSTHYSTAPSMVALIAVTFVIDGNLVHVTCPT
ncbi:unnamed protein product [Linum tenue]|uniref:Uncharacterized protein n=1 Tax=Linum tenue TaxID=586396 RepID=A0AAV0IDD6_9ROSI|nr:unnamed protein product [Linum tenue]